MSILEWLGFGKDPSPSASDSAQTETVRRIVGELDALPPQRARYVASFAYILSRVANADLDISAEETRAMEEILVRLGRLPAEQAILAVQIAKTQSRLFGGTENYLVTREFKQLATVDQRQELLHCLFAVSAADDSISSAEEAAVKQIASELGFTHEQFAAVRSEYNEQREVLRGL
jgi:uncharacterized tellurite resistance protein B-like protein